jgi:hypothetical protein
MLHQKRREQENNIVLEYFEIILFHTPDLLTSGIPINQSVFIVDTIRIN